MGFKGYEFTHKACTLEGSSGNPIFLANNTNVIGIHKSGNNKEKENYGDFIFPIINLLNNNNISKDYINNNLIHKQNELKIIVKISFPPLMLFGYEFIENNKDKCELFINGKNIDLDIVNNQDFLQEAIGKYNGKLEIILKGTKIITNMDYMFELRTLGEFISINFENWDVSNVTSMKNLLFKCNNIKGISNFYTSKVTNMSHMF